MKRTDPDPYSLEALRALEERPAPKRRREAWKALLAVLVAVLAVLVAVLLGAVEMRR